MQKNLFYGSLMDMLDTNDPLVILANNIDWSKFENEFKKHYKNENKGRPNKPIRLMVGLLLLKQLENLSDERIIIEWKRNPYFQYFCGYNEFQTTIPCHSTELVKFRNRIGVKGFEYIFKHSIEIHNEKDIREEVIIDTTVQESNLTYPTDGKLAIKIINHLHKIAKKEEIKLRRSYIKEIKQHRINLRFYRHPKKIKKAKASMKRLKTIAKTLIRDIDRKFGENLELHKKYAEEFYLYMKILNQTKKSKNKIYSLHEIDAYAVNKGKEHKGYEYGTKASIVTTKNSGIIIGVSAHKKNEHDSKTLQLALENTISNVGKTIKEAICDRGYRGVKQVNVDNHIVDISIPGNRLKKDTPKQIKEKREKFKRRAAIEPVIGHLKSDHRMQKNYLKGFVGDQINLLLAATAFNLKKWMRIYFFALFLRDVLLLTIVLKEINKIKQSIEKLYLISCEISLN
jgi:IS5 family transposase